MPMLINEPLAAIPGRTYTAWIPSNPPLATALTCFSSNVAFSVFDQSTPCGFGRWL